MTVKRVGYSYNSALEEAGLPAYFFDCTVVEDGERVVDTHTSHRSLGEFYTAIEGVIPVFGLQTPTFCEDYDESTAFRNAPEPEESY